MKKKVAFDGNHGDNTLYLFATIESSSNIDWEEVLKNLKKSDSLSLGTEINIACSKIEPVFRTTNNLEIINNKIVFSARYSLGEYTDFKKAMNDGKSIVKQICHVVELFES